MRNIFDCNVCVIGGAGFLGSHLVDHLIDKCNCQVLVLDNLITGQKKHLHKDAEFKWYDIRDSYTELAKLFLSYDIDFVFNYAAEPYIPESFERPLHFFEINATAVLNVLQAVDASNVQALLQVSSAEIYGDMTGKITERDIITPHSTYGVSKMAADGLVQVRWREARTPAIAMRQFNCLGERETHEYVIPEIISQLAEPQDIGIPPKVYLGNNSFRDFLYAGDAIAMAVDLLGNGEFGAVYNMGSESGIKIYDLARKIGKLMHDTDIEIVEDAARARPWEIWHLQSDNTKLYGVIETRPKVSLEEGLKRTINYFYENNRQWDW